MSPLPPYAVKVHHYLPSTTSTSSKPPRPVQAYEHVPTNSSPSETEEAENALVFIGGLGDGPHTIPYVRRIAEHLSQTAAAGAGSGNARWSVFEARLSSAFTGYGYASLAQDAREAADLVRYLRSGTGRKKKRVVLMGHSTGCQDCLEYAARYCQGGGGPGAEEVRVDGFVLQGPVSDREAIGLGEDAGEVQSALRAAREMVDAGRGAEVVPSAVLPAGWRGSPVTAYRWCSLAGVGGDDDYFSSDIPDEKLAAVWGKLEQPVLIVPSEKEEWVPESVDVTALVNRWKSFSKPGIVSELSGLIPDADHRVENEAGQEWLADRVARFLAEIESRETR